MPLPRQLSHKFLLLLAMAAFAVMAISAQPQNNSYSGNPTGLYRYIVILDTDKSGAAADPGFVRNESLRLSHKFNGRVADLFSATIKGFSIDLSEADAAAMSKAPGIRSIQRDLPIYPASVQAEPTWALDRLDQRLLPLRGNYHYDTTGAGVNVYVVDSGIRGTHSEFGGRVSYAYDAFDDGQNGYDCFGHGTHVAASVGGMTYGVAKSANLHAVRVLNCSGAGSVSSLISAIEWITENRQDPAIVNISITAGLVVQVLDDALNASSAAGITYIVAAANNGADACQYSPGRASSAVTVGATANTDLRPNYSNFGPCLDLFAPGHFIISAGISDDQVAVVRHGTSMAAPHVAGAAALFLESAPYASPAEVTSALINFSTPDIVTNAGEGSPNRLLYSMFSDLTSEPIRNVKPENGLAFVGTIKPVEWENRGDYNSQVTIELSTNGGTSFDTVIASGIENTGSFDWNVPYLPSSQARLRVREYGRTAPSATSSSDFVITLAPTSATVSISGRAVDGNGRGVSGATVSFVDAEGQRHSSITNSFGVFYIEGLRAGTSYFTEVRHKRYIFANRIITPDEDLAGVILIGN